MGIQFDGINNEIKSQTKIDFPGSVGVAGTLTYEDVANVDSIGIITARTGINIGPTAGVAGTFYSDGSYVTAGVVTATTFHGSGASLTNLPAANLTGTLPAISGANLTGIDTDLVSDTSPQLGGNLDTNSHNIYLDDDHKVIFGNTISADLHIFHESSSGTGNIYNATGELRIRTDDLRLKNLGNSETYLKAVNNGAVELYHDNSKRFETTADGIKLYPDASGILIESGGDTTWTTGAMNVVRMGSNQADIRLGSNYGVKIGISGNNDANEFQIQQDNQNNGYIRNEASNKIEFQTGGSTARFRIDNNGNCTVNDGNLVIGTSGHGIDFSATADASLMQYAGTGADPSTDSEVLSDYEHGTWTPRIRAYDHTGGAGWGTLKYTDGTDVTGTGRYVKVGNHVWAGFKIESGSKTFDSNWTYFSIDSTPYGANNYDKASGSLYVSQTNFFTDSNSHIGGFVHGGESYMVVNKPNGHSNAQLNTSNNNRYCYGHISIYSSRY